MHYRQIVILVVCCLVALGIYSLPEMRKNEFPGFYGPSGTGGGSGTRQYLGGDGGAGDEAAGELYFQLQGGKEGENFLDQPGWDSVYSGGAER